MAHVSTPIGELRAEYDVVVVGSGYGGGVAARRMAERACKERRPLSICVLERGHEWRAPRFPSSFPSAARQIQLETRFGRLGRTTGLFDFRIDRDISVLVGCGLGGTSLINAGVMLEPTDEVWRQEGWPASLKTAERPLGDEYDSVMGMLGAQPCPDDVDLPKLRWLAQAGERACAPAMERPPIAVSFTTARSDAGSNQQRCTLCGNCVTGCNHGAKNTVDRTYLTAAARKGVAILCGLEVRALEPAASGDGTWVLHVRGLEAPWRAYGRPEWTIRAGAVFLAAGTLGSTEILLRSRARYGLALSPALGTRFSGNGDVLAFSYNSAERVNGMGHGHVVPADASVGPTIAGMLDERREKRGNGRPGEKDTGGRAGGKDPADRLMIQEGAIPRALALPLRLLGPVVARVTRLPADTSFDWRFAHLRRELDSLIRGGRHGALARTQTFLVMGHDDGAGTLTLARDALRIGWNTLERQKVFKAIQARLFMLTQAMGGRYVMNPFWTRLFGRRLLTVHPLGGCAMADTPEHGVVNGMGRVFSSGSGTDFHSNLYVCDGSIVPHALGTNPALTIAALAERIAKGAPLPASLGSDVSAPSRVDASVTGIEYAERLRGWLRLDGQPTRLQLVLHISAPSVDDLIGRRRDGGTEKSAKRPAPPGRTDESRETPETEAARDRRSATTAGPADRPGSDADRHQASVIGVAWTPDLDGERRRWTVSQGTLNVLVHDPRLVDTRLLVYHLKLTSASGERFWIHGHKTINLETCRRHPWRAVTTFSFRAYRPERSNEGRPGCGHTLPIEDDEQFGRLCDWVEWIEKDMPGRVPAGEGRVRAGTADVARMIGSVRITDAPGWSAKVAAASRLAAYFLDVWIQALAWPLQRTVRIDPFQPVQVKVPGSVVTRKGDIIEGCETDAGLIPYRLTPYSSKGRAPAGDPVILAPGFGMNADAFLVGRPSLVEFLIERNYDPWLLDYRGSDHLEISLTQFTLDDLVGDFEEAIRKLYRKSQRPVRIIAHCVASLATTMALLTREGLGDCVHSVILSQSFAFMDHPWLNRVKAHLRLPQLLRFLGVDSVLTADLDLRSPFWARVLDRLLHFYPTVEQCSSGVCRRLLFLYGEVVRHENLDRRTHDMLYELFDRANLTTFVHLARMIRSGHIVDRHGRNAYLVAENGRRLTMPITLLQGRRNRLFRPAGGRLTHEWLLEHGYDRDRAENERRFALDVIDGYGHLDNFIGKRAHEHVFPELIRLLARMDEVRGGVAAGK